MIRPIGLHLDAASRVPRREDAGWWLWIFEGLSAER